MDNGFGVGVGLEVMALGLESSPQFAEILDDAVVDHGNLRGHVRMRIALGRTAVSRPARVADAGAPGERLDEQPLLEIAQFAFGAAAFKRASFDGRHPGRIIAAVLKPAKRIDKIGRNGRFSEDSDDPAHQMSSLNWLAPSNDGGG